MYLPHFYRYFDFGEDKYLQGITTAGTITCYVSMLFNLFVFVILWRKSLFSPASILMQGLAVADFLTAFSSYGLEPFFQSQLDCTGHYFENITQFVHICGLTYPYCTVSTHLSILSVAFHTISYMLTTCLGIQKVVAIMFPIWTKCQLTNRKSFICCVSCFLLSMAISFPRHFAVKLESAKFEWCKIVANDLILEYSTLYYLMIQTVIVICCCLVMLMSTAFITYKLFTNKFSARITQQRAQERRSIIMVVIVLVVFLISEVPKVIAYLLFCVRYIVSNFLLHYDFSYLVVLVVTKYEQGLAALLTISISDDNISFWESFEYYSYVFEGMKLLTIAGCLSNFLIYIIISKKMRAELSCIFGKQTSRSNVKEMNKHYPMKISVFERSKVIKVVPNTAGR